MILKINFFINVLFVIKSRVYGQFRKTEKIFLQRTCKKSFKKLYILLLKSNNIWHLIV